MTREWEQSRTPLFALRKDELQPGDRRPSIGDAIKRVFLGPESPRKENRNRIEVKIRPINDKDYERI